MHASFQSCDHGKNTPKLSIANPDIDCLARRPGLSFFKNGFFISNMSLMRAVRDATESETRADMWFRRAGELLDEVSKLREQVASATAVAALVKAEAAGAGTTARSEVAAARSEAAALAAKCDLLQRQIDERTESLALDDEHRRRHVAEIEAERSEKRRMALELSYVQQARDIAEKEQG